ncbi:hypothetical protein RZE82_00490 [Mollicutes bacterium LVI A0039]|nr:hypothetical protein RZE82_00490 [Mollicutes bacterium LVI A0039]
MTKKSLCIEEQIEHLELNKKVEIDNVDEQRLLTEVGYINLISPYKHYYHVGKKSGKHVYPYKTNLSSYVDMYLSDKNITMNIRENLFEYEKLIKTQIGIALANKYDSCDTTNEIKLEIIKDLKLVISRVECSQRNERSERKIKYLNQLMEKFEVESEYYLIMNKLQFGELKTFKDIIPFKYQNSELKYFFQNGDTLRIIRNNISHSSFIEVYLNNLNRKLFTKNINALKRIGDKLLFSKHVEFNRLYNSYNKYEKNKIS